MTILERDASAEFRYWTDRARMLDLGTYAVALRGDRIDLNQHLEQLKIARVRKAHALEQLQTIRRAKPCGPVRLLDAPKADGRRVPIIHTAELRRLLQLERAGVKPTPRRFVWQPANQHEADEVMRTFGLSATKSAGRRGLAIERIR
jgi:hypothetical protein